MNKSERINHMMLFLYDKKSFHLKDLMQEYHISKSTALRDIETLEQLGMTLYSEHGRNGYYGNLRNKLLSPIVFNVDEVFALYFSMLTLRAYETTPFHLCVENLKKKFENCLSAENVNKLRSVEKVFSLASIQHNNHCRFLNDILQFAIEEKVCIVTYRKESADKEYVIQFFRVSSAYGQWYATGYSFETERTQVFRCDKISGVRESHQYQPRPLEEFTKSAEALYKLPNATDFEVEISQKGADLFDKEHYPSMKLDQEHGRWVIRGFYNQGEEKFIANYFIAYGENIRSIQPTALKNLILEGLHSFETYLLKIC
ncbi:MAG: YafY family protein [Clostridia bacterium]